MLDENFISFVTSLFPNIDPFIEKQTKESLKQFYDSNGSQKLPMITTSDLSGLCQGDILSNIKFLKWDYGETLKVNSCVTDGIVISNSCDIENDDEILIAPLYSIKSIDKKCYDSIYKNIIYSKIYLPELEKGVGDFSSIQPFPKKLITDKISEQKIKKVASLNLVGYYFFICKLTVHLLRPENQELQDERRI